MNIHEHQAKELLKKYEEIALTITDHDSYFVNLINTLYFFNEVI